MVRSIDTRRRRRRVTVSLTTPGCPIRSHFETAVARGGRRPRRRHARQRRLRRPLRPGEGRPAAEARPPAALPEGALAQVANVVCVGSGKGGVGKSTITANLAAALAAEGKQRRRPRRRRLGLLDPAHVRRSAAARRSRAERKILPLEELRREGHVDRLLRRGGLRRRLARADAPQGAHAVPRGRRRGASSTSCSSTCRPGTGDVSMTLAQLLPQAKFLIVTTPQPVAQKVARRAAEMAHKVDLEIARRHREHGRLRHPGRRALRALRRGRRAGAGRRARRAAARQGAADDAAARAGRRRRAAGLHRPRRSRRRRRSATPRAGSSRCSRSSCRSCRRASPRRAGRRRPRAMSLPMAG